MNHLLDVPLDEIQEYGIVAFSTPKGLRCYTEDHKHPKAENDSTFCSYCGTNSWDLVDIIGIWQCVLCKRYD